MVKKIITVKEYNMPDIEVNAEIWFNIFGWHKDGKLYRLTHVPTGLALLSNVEYKNKKAFKEALKNILTDEIIKLLNENDSEIMRKLPSETV